MMLWKFEVFINSRGRCDVQKTIDDYLAADSIRFERAVEHLAISPLDQWNEPYAKKVTLGDKKFKAAGFKLHEIRYTAQKREERALGYFPSGQNTFVILLICYHKQKIYVPTEAFDIAFERFKAHKEGRASSRTLQIDGEDFPQDEEE
jgi:hypothetical protein